MLGYLKGVFPCSTGVVVSTFGHPLVDFEIDVFAVMNGRGDTIL